MPRCPKCRSANVLHDWRADMPKLQTIDNWKCATCGTHWQDVATYPDLSRQR